MINRGNLMLVFASQDTSGKVRLSAPYVTRRQHHHCPCPDDSHSRVLRVLAALHRRHARQHNWDNRFCRFASIAWMAMCCYLTMSVCRSLRRCHCDNGSRRFYGRCGNLRHWFCHHALALAGRYRRWTLRTSALRWLSGIPVQLVDPVLRPEYLTCKQSTQ